MLNIMLIMQISSPYWVSVRLRFISFCISQSLNYLRNLKVYMTSSRHFVMRAGKFLPLLRAVDEGTLL